MRNLSEWAKTVVGHYPLKAFMALRRDCAPKAFDINAFVRTNILEGIPRAFIRYPMVFDCLRCYVSDKLDISPEQVCMTGSAKLGFSLSPKKWLQKYSSKESDLDIFIVSDLLFLRFSRDFSTWKEEYSSKIVAPSGTAEKKHWDDAIDSLDRSTKRGFIDHYNIPTLYEWPKKCEIVCGCLPVYVNKLLKSTGITVRRKPGSIRIYKNTKSAIEQISLNITTAIDKQ